MKWEAKGVEIGDYNERFIRKCHENGITFMGGGTATIISPSESIDIYDFATRNAEGRRITPPGYIEHGAGLRRGSLANPAYREYVVNYLRKQIDLGVDGVSFDEVYGYYGRICVKWPWDKEEPHRRYFAYRFLTLYFDFNEGFDDYFIADFNRYLMNKYPGLSETEWMQKFAMIEDNLIRYDVSCKDLKNNFNYRRYLREHGFAKDPHNPENPLAREWGLIRSNRPDIGNDCFMERYLKLYWKEMVVALRTYAREKYGKEIWITANGIYPYTDFNSLGVNGHDGDYDSGDCLEYLPQKSGHLDGSVSLKHVYLQIKEWNDRMSGDVPLVLFIDDPTPLAAAYYKLPREEKKDFWRIYGAEMYACGVFPAYTLKMPMWESPTAAQSGVLDFFIEDSRFYKNNRDLYLGVKQTNKRVDMDNPHIEYNVTYQKSRNRYLLHLINHNYAGRILPQEHFKVSIEMERPPKSVSCITPSDPAGPVKTEFEYRQKLVIIEIKRIDNYAVLTLEL